MHQDTNLQVVLAKSRLGLRYAPYGGKGDKNNIGVELGPEVIYREAKLTNSDELIDLDFPRPELINPNTTNQRYLEIVAEEFHKSISKITNNWKQGKKLVTLGGDHSVAFVSLASVINRFAAKNIFLLQIDSHTDIHSLNTSPSGNLHGMWVRPFLGRIGLDALDSLIPNKLNPENVLYYGNLTSEPQEKAYIKERGITTIPPGQQAKVLGKIKSAKHIHVSIDIDGFDKSIAAATGIPAENGLALEDISEIAGYIRSHESYSLDLVEYNPKKDDQAKTLGTAIELMRLFGVD